jgi:hypothetical protein
MDPGTEHERPAKRAKRDDTEDTLTPPPNSHENGDHDVEEPDFVSDNNNAAQGSDLYLDTVCIPSSVCLHILKPPSGKSCRSRL